MCHRPLGSYFWRNQVRPRKRRRNNRPDRGYSERSGYSSSGTKAKSGYRSHFLYLGRFAQTAQKDYETLLRAFDRLVMEFQDCDLTLVGGGEREGEIRSLLVSLTHARSRTEMVGFCDPKPWLERADALIHPSLAEGMSNTLLEGMAHGVTRIANDIPPNREVLGGGEAGILVPVGDVDSLVQAMRRLATVPGECEQWRPRGRKRAEEVYRSIGSPISTSNFMRHF